ncbi:MAG: glycoside hydrolase family 130 protein [Planctomycetota bacterium]|jgi:predicted GH43/DUF377 family glycosyl hydrolase|nr:glycoside hydrolase family 130 protein [Planctomycetota bacterium]
MNTPPPTWLSTGFSKRDAPILGPDATLRFTCPISGQSVAWAEKDVFNPSVTRIGDEICLLIRAEDTIGHFKGTSRIGLATSSDGIHFSVEPEPVIYPDHDAYFALEREGGCEDPRVVVRDDGLFVCTYSAFNGSLCYLCVATSRDLRTWTKHGPAFAGSPWERIWSKSGCIVSQWVDDRLQAVQIDGQYWMYWGEGLLHAATSNDCIHWQPVSFAANANRIAELDQAGRYANRPLPGACEALLPLACPRPGRFDHCLVEPGPAAVLTDAGIVLWYNGSTPGADAGVYSCGQVLFDPCNPSQVQERPLEPFLVPDQPWELAGQCAAVTFSEGLVRHQGQELLYYGCADSHIGVAIREL